MNFFNVFNALYYVKRIDLFIIDRIHLVLIDLILKIYIYLNISNISLKILKFLSFNISRRRPRKLSVEIINAIQIVEIKVTPTIEPS